jgi:hypothetical protein
VNSTSGFNFELPRCQSRNDLSLQLIEFCHHYRKPIAALNEREIRSTIDVGFAVGDKLHYTGTIDFPPHLLHALASLKVHLEVSAYPSSDE